MASLLPRAAADMREICWSVKLSRARISRFGAMPSAPAIRLRVVTRSPQSNVLVAVATAQGFETRRYRAWLGSMVSMTRSGRRVGYSLSRHRETRVTIGQPRYREDPYFGGRVRAKIIDKCPCCGHRLGSRQSHFKTTIEARGLGARLALVRMRPQERARRLR